MNGRRSVTLAGQGSVIETENYGHTYPAADFLNKRFVPVIAELHKRTLADFGEMIRHHVKEEQDEMFPKLRKTSMDMVAIGRKLEKRRAELESAAMPSGAVKPTIWDRLLSAGR